MKLITQVLAGLLALVMPLGAKADETRTPVPSLIVNAGSFLSSPHPIMSASPGVVVAMTSVTTVRVSVSAATPKQTERSPKMTR